MFQSIMRLHIPSDCSLGLGFAVQVAYLVGFVTLAKTKAIWREA